MQPTVKGTSLLLLQKIEMSPFVTYSDLAFARKELPEGKKTRVGTCLALKFTGQTAELCLHLPVQADLAYSPWQTQNQYDCKTGEEKQSFVFS